MKNLIPKNIQPLTPYLERVEQLISEGLSRSDAQGIADIEGLEDNTDNAEKSVHDQVVEFLSDF